MILMATSAGRLKLDVMIRLNLNVSCERQNKRVFFNNIESKPEAVFF